MGTVTAAVLAGAALSGLLDRRPESARFAVAFSAGVMLAVCMLYLIPDAFLHAGSQNSTAIGCALSLGFLSLLTIERYLLRAHHHHDHGHGHDAPLDHAPHDLGEHDCREDHAPPHHHQHGSLSHGLGVAWSTVVALWLHGLFDGVALYAAGVMPTMGPALALALILHKVPETATLLTVLRRSPVQQRGQRLALWLYVLATPVGMLAAAQILQVLSGHGMAGLMAFVAGSLLHLVTGHLLPEATEHEADGKNHGAYAVMLAGWGVLLLARLLGAG